MKEETEKTIHVEIPKTMEEVRWYPYPEYAPKGSQSNIFIIWDKSAGYGESFMENFCANAEYQPEYASKDPTSCWRSVKYWMYPNIVEMIPKYFENPWKNRNELQITVEKMISQTREELELHDDKEMFHLDLIALSNNLVNILTTSNLKHLCEILTNTEEKHGVN
ncbi:hypothetical protein [Candidatus Lokiarchaeum ossiferum]|uniref:hypothetical protein n=1 Tax=Candidatus Lokiarchaeum ossiferum TaxID=2951803 RepID=UPI00352E0F0E